MLAIALVVAFFSTRRSRHQSGIYKLFSDIARRSHLAVFLVFLVAIVGRVAMLNTNPLPQPVVADEFGYLLGADTYQHFRLTNPTPPFWHHFETIHQLMVPTYMTKYPPAQSLFLALGSFIFHSPAIAVILSSAAMAAVLCWQLQAMTPPVWAFLGGLLAAVRIATISYWADSYWGGSVAALFGCLLLGSVMRWVKKPSASMAFLAAVSTMLLVNCRPFEGGLLVMGSLAYLVWMCRKAPRHAFNLKTVTPFLAVAILGVAAMAVNNRIVTGNATLLPYVCQTQQYGVTPSLLFQKEKQTTKVYRYEKEKILYTVWERLPYDDQRTLGVFT
jgi:hypothetical protein